MVPNHQPVINPFKTSQKIWSPTSPETLRRPLQDLRFVLQRLRDRADCGAVKVSGKKWPRGPVAPRLEVGNMGI